MFFIGDNNSREVTQETIDEYLGKPHRADSIYGLSKGNYFWAKDMTFGSQEQAGEFIKGYESRGFKVYHNIEDIEVVTKKKVDPIEETQKVKRKNTGGRRKKEPVLQKS